mgnify:CR=1 FL=1
MNSFLLLRSLGSALLGSGVVLGVGVLWFLVALRFTVSGISWALVSLIGGGILNEIPRALVPSTLLVEVARKELFLVILGGELGELADRVIKVAPGKALFSMSLRWASNSLHF